MTPSLYAMVANSPYGERQLMQVSARSFKGRSPRLTLIVVQALLVWMRVATS